MIASRLLSRAVSLTNLFPPHPDPADPNPARPLPWASFWLPFMPEKVRTTQRQKNPKSQISVCADFTTATIRKDAACRPASSARRLRSAHWRLCVNPKPWRGAKRLPARLNLLRSPRQLQLLQPRPSLCWATNSCVDLPPRSSKGTWESWRRILCRLQRRCRDLKLSLWASDIPRWAVKPASTASAPSSASLTSSSKRRTFKNDSASCVKRVNDYLRILKNITLLLDLVASEIIWYWLLLSKVFLDIFKYFSCEWSARPAASTSQHRSAKLSPIWHPDVISWRTEADKNDPKAFNYL